MNTIMRQAVGPKAIAVPVCISLEEEMDALSEGQKGQGEVLIDLQEADRAMDVAAALEDLAFVASTMQEVTPKEAALIQIVADTSVAGSGLSGDLVAPAMEEETSGSSIAAGVNAAIKRIVDTITKVVQSLVNTVMEYVRNFGKTAGNAAERVKKLKDRFEKFEGRVDGSVKMNVPSISNGGGETYNPDELGQAFAGFLGAANAVMAGGRDYVSSIGQSAVDAFSNASDAAKVLRAVELIGRDCRSFAGKGFRQDGTSESVENQGVSYKLSHYSTGDLLGGVSIDLNVVEVTNFEEGKGAEAVLQAVNGNTFKFSQSLAIGENIEVSAMKGKSIEKMIWALDMMAAQLNLNDPKSLMSISKARAEQGKILGDKIKQAVSGYKSDFPEAQAYAQSALRASKHLMDLSTTPYIKMTQLLLRMTNVGIRYVTASLDAYEAEYSAKVTGGKMGGKPAAA